MSHCVGSTPHKGSSLPPIRWIISVRSDFSALTQIAALSAWRNDLRTLGRAPGGLLRIESVAQLLLGMFCACLFESPMRRVRAAPARKEKIRVFSRPLCRMVPRNCCCGTYKLSSPCWHGSYSVVAAFSQCPCLTCYLYTLLRH